MEWSGCVVSCQNTPHKVWIVALRWRCIGIITKMRHTRIKFLLSQDPRLDQPLGMDVKPLFVVTGCQIVRRFHTFNGVSETSRNWKRRSHGYAVNPSFPGVMEDRFVIFTLDW